MKKINNQSGFSAVELLITLVIAAVFVTIGYQFYAVIIKDGGETRLQSVAGSAANEYLQRYKSLAKNPCSDSIPSLPTNESKTVSGLTNVTLTIQITCPYGTTSSISKVMATINYGTPQTSISSATFTKPKCLDNFIEVPGSTTYLTSDFCVMKYEAKKVGATNVPISEVSNTPWVSITQTDAAAYSPNVAGCTGCHLITEAEWMTIAQNVLSVPSNWSGGTIGNVSIPRGNSDSGAATDASANLSGINKRTLTLTNGQVIWDFAGNVWEWTSGQTTGGQPGITGEANAYAWKNWNDTPMNKGTGVFLAVSPFPSDTGISGANGWNATTNGIGRLNSNSNVAEATLRGFIRGGNWNDQGDAGVLALSLLPTPSDTNVGWGFRVAQ